MLLKNKKIAIIGGGPGGLTLARLLQLKGVDVTVYERDVNKDVRVQGGALDLHEESGLAALRKAGLLEAFKENFRPGAEKIRVTDENAAVLLDGHLEEDHLNFGDKHFRPEIDRGPLRDILLESLRPGTIVWNSHILSIEPLDNSWKIHLGNGSSALVDVVIGADGANSKIRPFVTSVKPLWAGVTMIEGSIKDGVRTAPRIHALLKGGKIFAYGKEQTLIVSSKGDGSFGFAVSWKTSEHWVKESGIDFKDHKQVLAWFKKEFSTWGSIWHELFEDENTIFIPRPQYCMPLNLRWETKSNITLLGDAAHWMPPFAGEGVNMAMLDALELSESLTDPAFGTIKAALIHYEKKMFKRFARIGKLTMFNTEWMHEPQALKNMLSMFGKNVINQWLFVGKMWIRVTLMPISRMTLYMR
ncbi:MAG: FAD-dependent monooxygenase [Chitinophagaceae bacterium]|nr:FAD-dependent monooxygenase [Chitinophagaceae bacterium]